MCLECLQLFGVSLDPAHHAAIKRRPNRHVRRVTPVTPVTPPAKKTKRSKANVPR